MLQRKLNGRTPRGTTTSPCVPGSVGGRPCVRVRLGVEESGRIRAFVPRERPKRITSLSVATSAEKKYRGNFSIILNQQERKKSVTFFFFGEVLGRVLNSVEVLWNNDVTYLSPAVEEREEWMLLSER